MQKQIVQVLNPFDLGIPPVFISPQGIFKYILIQCIINEVSAYFIRGSTKFKYHAENYDSFAKQLQKKGYTIDKLKGKDQKRYFVAKKGSKIIKCECLGGGRIQHKYNNNKCFIYGYSKSFGKVDHQIAKKFISSELKYKMEQIKTSKQGY